MAERRTSLAVVVGVAASLAVLVTGAFLSGGGALDPIRLVVLLVAVAGALVVLVRLRDDLLLGMAISLSLFLPYVNVSGVDVRISTFLPTAFLLAGIVATARDLGVNTRAFRDAFVRWMVAYVSVVVVSTVVNLGRLSPDSLPFVVLWLTSHVFFLVYVAYRPRTTLARQLHLGRQIQDVMVLAAFVALVLGMVEYFNPAAVQELFAPSRRVGLWGARGALAEWLVPLRRTGSVIGSPNAFGAMLAVGALVALGPGRRGHPWRVAGGLVLAAGVVLLSTSRGATMGFLAGVSTYVATSRYRWWAVPLLAAAVGVGALMPATVEFIGGGYAPEEAVVGRSLPAAAERYFVWQRALGVGLSPVAWVVGNGPVNEPFVFRTGLRGGHNLLVTSFAFFGLLGVVVVAALCREVVRATYRLRRDPRTRPLARATFAVFVALATHSLVDDILFHNTSIMLLVFPLLAMVVRVRQLVDAEGPGPGP